MARKRRFSEEPFGPTIERLMDETGVTYRGLAAKTGLSAGYLNHLVHGNRPVPSNDVIDRLADALGVEPEHFREYRLRVITERLEEMPAMIDRLYKQLAEVAPSRRPRRCDLRYGCAHGAWRSLVSALVWGTRGPEFESRRPDGTACKWGGSVIRRRSQRPYSDSERTRPAPCGPVKRAREHVPVRAVDHPSRAKAR